MSRGGVVEVVRADAPDDRLAELFVAYRQFYGRAGDEEAARDFLRLRLERRDSLVWRAVLDGVAVGFVQVYPQHSSLRLTTDWVLNDLYVASEARGHGVARYLVTHVLEEAAAAGAGVVRLETQTGNAPARALYESLGFRVAPADREFVTYERRVGGVG